MEHLGSGDGVRTRGHRGRPGLLTPLPVFFCSFQDPGTQVFPWLELSPLVMPRSIICRGPSSSPASVRPQARHSLAHASHAMTAWVKPHLPSVLVASYLPSFPGPRGAWPVERGAVGVGGRPGASASCREGSPIGREARRRRVWSWADTGLAPWASVIHLFVRQVFGAPPRAVGCEAAAFGDTSLVTT